VLVVGLLAVLFGVPDDRSGAVWWLVPAGAVVAVGRAVRGSRRFDSSGQPAQLLPRQPPVATGRSGSVIQPLQLPG
jgi:hypothetical protein